MKSKNKAFSNLWIIVPAAGVGRRMQSVSPKQYLDIEGKTVLEYSLQALVDLSANPIHLVLADDDEYFSSLPIAQAIAQKTSEKITIVSGGKERSDSVFNAVQQLSEFAQEDDWVLIHDAARPCIKTSDVVQAFEILLEKHNADQQIRGGLLALPVRDTVKQVAGEKITGTADRNAVMLAQTPQIFSYSALCDALQQQRKNNAAITDEAMAMEMAGYQLIALPGTVSNLKITTPEDIDIAKFWLSKTN